MRLKAIIFDIDGTLYRSREYEVYLRGLINEVLGELLGIGAEEAGRRLEEVKRELRTVSASIEALGADRRRLFEMLGKRIEPWRYLKPRPEVKRVLRELRGAGLRLGCHTNSGRRLMEKVLAALDLSPRDFHACVTSDDAAPKPSKEGYILLLKLLDTSPERTLYVGDRWEVEVKPAKELGMMTAMVYERKGNPDIFLNDVTELPEKLRELNPTRRHTR